MNEAVAKQQRITARQWVASGNDFVVDGLWGRLGVQQTFGDTLISGAANGLATKEDPSTGKIYLYSGAVNGGVYGRVYDQQRDRWSKGWSWLSKPGSGYGGSQAVGHLAISEDGRFLAVGQGNASNYAAVAPPSGGVQIGRIESDGNLSWLPVPATLQQQMNGLNVRSLIWQGNTLRGTAWSGSQRNGATFTLDTDDGVIQSISLDQRGSLNLVADAAAGHYLEAGHDSVSGLNQIAMNGRTLTGEWYQQLLESFDQELIGRLSVVPHLVNGKLIAFVGTFAALRSAQPIFRVIRLEIDPASGELVSVRTTNPRPPYLPDDGDVYGFFGSNQAGNDRYYGNFSFEADPFDPEGESIFVGGNQYAYSPVSPSTLYTSGLIRVDFDQDTPRLTFLYGPRVERDPRDIKSGEASLKEIFDGDLVIPFSPGAPHADSRSVAFYQSAKGPVLLQSDDGGVWQLPQSVSKNGLELPADAWWTSLSAKGMATLELNQVDWNAAHNMIVSSYQDNASSIGYFGDSNATNIGNGDGQIALFDDADPRRVSAYIAPQFYYKDGYLSSVNLDRNGFARSISYRQFFLADPARGLIPWQSTPEAKHQGGSFMLPVEMNAYRSGSLVQTGYCNIYESIDPGNFSDVAIIFRPLLPESSSLQLTPTALDHQGVAEGNGVTSLYVGGYLPNQSIALWGRQGSDGDRDYQLRRLVFTNLDQKDLSAAGQVIDLTHAPSRGSGDLLYWLQGGIGLAYGLRLPSTSVKQQVLRIGRDGSSVKSFSLAELGLPITDGDHYGFQALQYVPETEHHPELLLISGLAGVWASELTQDGTPTGFKPMPWLALPDSGPGAYIRSLKYDPNDDLLIAASQGKGSYLYSFSGDIHQRPKAKRILHAADLTLSQSADPTIDKRGNETNAMISISLDRRLLDEDKKAILQFTLHDARAWRKAMEFVSVYNTNVTPDYKTIGRATHQAFRYNNILDDVGLRFRGGQEQGGNLTFPMELAAGSALFNLQVNAKDSDVLRRFKPLKYSVSLANTGERLTRKVRFDPLPPITAFADAPANGLLAVDPISGLPTTGSLSSVSLRSAPGVNDSGTQPQADSSVVAPSVERFASVEQGMWDRAGLSSIPDISLPFSAHGADAIGLDAVFGR